MLIDLLHNFIVKSTITEKFTESVEKKLIPKLEEKYGAALLGIQMYEDYISDAFYTRGEWYYPLTVILPAGPATEWVKWRMKAGSFKDGLPYAYVGEGLLELNLAADVPADFVEKMNDRSICYSGGAMTVNVETRMPDPTFLAGKYSQTFVDEMARQLTVKISEAMSVSGLEASGISLSLVFNPGTFMEHISENTTYRRLQINDGVSAPRDFWVKWVREDGATAFTSADRVNAENVIFEIGEDVPQKVKEREYRYLLAESGDKYHNATGRKNITEWREIIKRAVKRGDLVKIEAPEVSVEADDITAKLAAVLGKEPTPQVATETPAVKEENDDFARAMEIARSIMAERESVDLGNAAPAKATQLSFDDIEEVAPVAEEVAPVAEEVAPVAEEVASAAEEVAPVAEEIAPAAEEAALVAEESPLALNDVFEEIDDEDVLEEEESVLELAAIDGTEELQTTQETVEEPKEEVEKVASGEPAAEIAPTVSRAALEAQIRAEVEARVRLEYESRARRQAEEEAEKLRLAAEELRRKNQQLLEEAEAERARIAKAEEVRRAEEAKLRAQLEEQLAREAKEKERLAEAARFALEQARREEAEKAREEALKRAVEERRLAEERRADEERRRAEEAARIAERKAAEEKARANAAIGSSKSKNYTYTSKSVKLLFRRAVDPNITARIYEIIKTTLEYYGKDKVYMRIKATIPDGTTVILEFVEIPMEEMALLSNIIKVLGNSGLGIAKAIVD